MTWINTRAGKYDFGKLLEGEAGPGGVNVVDPMDVAWAMAHTCRFGGHCTRFYSVAEHTWRMLSAVDQVLAGRAAAPELTAAERLRLDGMVLVHDAHEAYVGDVPRPLKPLLGESWRRLEAAAEAEVRQQLAPELEAADPLWEICDLIDRAQCLAEGRELMAGGVSAWTDRAVTTAPRVAFNTMYDDWSPKQWAARWLSQYREWRRRMRESARLHGVIVDPLGSAGLGPGPVGGAS